MPVRESSACMALLRLFGHPVLERDGTRAPIGLSPKGVTLIALLAANASHALSRESLAQTLWPDLESAEARANLRRYLYAIGKALGDDVLRVESRSAQWNTSSNTAVDIVRFDAHAAQGDARALEEYSGEICAGIEDEALEPLRLRYRSQYEALLRSLIQSAQRDGDDEALGRYLTKAIAYDPLDEQSVRALMELRLRQGDRAGAMREYTSLAQRLRSDIGAEPEDETSALYRAMANADSTSAVPNNLVRPPTSFVGRERERAAVAEALRTGGIVTLTGPGGVGKSRLAVRCAFDLLHAHPGGVWLVELEHASSDSEIWERIGEALHVSGGEQRESAVCAHLAKARALLVLDTCEHVPDAARRIAETLMRQTASAVLATSRRPLQGRGERVIAVDPLDSQTAYHLFLERAVMVNPSFRLDARQAGIVQQLIENIDRLPLAIELVASRANVLTVEGMRKRLHAAMPLEETIAWSYDLLPDDARELLERLSVFRGSFGRSDAEAVAGNVPDVSHALREVAEASLAATLTDGGHDTRFRLLETTRVFAWKRLEGRGALEAALLSHAEHFAKRADALATLSDAEFAPQVDSVAASMQEFLAALEQCAKHDWRALALRILEGIGRCALRKRFTGELLQATRALLQTAPEQPRLERLAGMFASLSGEHHMATRHLQAACELYERAGDEGRLCDALSGYAIAVYHLGRYEDTERILLDIEQRSRRMGDRALHAKTLGRLGSVYLSRGEFDRAYSLLAPGVTLLRDLGELHQLGVSLKNLAVAALYSGKFEEAVIRANELLNIPGATSDVALHAMVLCVRGNAERELGDLHAALRSQLAACALFPQIIDTADFAESIEDIVTTFAAGEAYEASARLLGLADAVRERIGTPVNPGLRLYYDLTLQRLRSALGARAESIRRDGRLLQFDEAMALIETTARSIDRRISRSDLPPAPGEAQATRAARDR